MKKIIVSTVSAVALCLLAQHAFAAGFHLSEYSATGMGRSFAGQGIMGDDYSAIAFNPAGMQYVEKDGVQAGASAVSLHFDYKGSIGTDASVSSTGIKPGERSGEGHTRPTRVLPHVFAQKRLSEKTVVGVGAYVPYGLATDYKNGWFAQSHAGISQLSATNLSPSLSYQVNDMLTLGAAVNIQYVVAHLGGNVENAGEPHYYLENMYSNMRGSDYGVGYTLGAAFSPRKDIRLGVSYRSKISHELEGHLGITGMPDASIKAKVTTPEVLVFSGAYDINKCFTASATAKWTRWSRFKNLDIYRTANNSLVSSTFENWKNTWFYALGLDYRYNQKWTFRTGIAYDDTVIKSPEYRTARIPDGRRVLTSLGGSYKVNNWQFDAGYTHIFAGSSWVRGGAKGYSRPNLKYSADAEMFSLGVQYKF